LSVPCWYEYLVIDSPEPGFGPQILAENPDRWEAMNPYEHLDDATVVNAHTDPGSP
jgi:hypothetical protein